MKSCQPKLFYNGVRDDRLAMEMLTEADITYIAVGPTTFESTPYIEYGYWRYDGIKGISRFIDAWRQNKLPSTELTST